MKMLWRNGGQKETEALKQNHDQVQKYIDTLKPESQETVLNLQRQVDQEIESINSSVFDFERENRLRSKGLSPREAEELALRIKEVKVGQLFEFRGQNKVLTPFKTVVSAQEYVTFLQERILENPQFKKEVELASALKSYTSLSSFGLIKLAIKQLFRSKKNG